ncbi:unnamed protein product [Paramecium pentaurelia]|uniref:Transmembrane protein n=1 Tax=Paramecium pentaurelia TaxID=43138 RepID=A0A8S1XMC7_9CILI|nr:unnamed protein product [Paramecium pentaurelia]
MLLFILFIPSYTLYCQNNLTIYASTYERKEWDLNKYFFGQDLTFSLNGDEENFELFQILQPMDATHIDLSDVTLLDIHSMKKQGFDTSYKAILIKNESMYQIRYPSIEIIYFETDQPCSFIRVIQKDAVLLAYGKRFWIAKQQNYYQVDSLILDIDIQDEKILILTKNDVQIYYYDGSFYDFNVVINTTVLTSLLPLASKSFEIIDAKLAILNQVVVLDKSFGVIILENINLDKFKLVYHHNYSYYSSYYAMSLMFEDLSYQIVVTTIQNSIFVLSPEGIDYFYWFNGLINFTQYRIAGLRVNSEQKYFTLYNTTNISIYSISNMVRMYSIQFETPILLDFNYQQSIIYLVTQNIQQSYYVSSAMLIMKPFTQPSNEFQRLQVIGTEESQCAITFNYIIYDYLDNNLYQKTNVKNQIKPFVNYPTYPQVSIFKELGVTGSNINAKIYLNDQSISLKLGYLEDMKINGIIWPENMLYISMFYSGIYTYYVIQLQTLKATLYQCRVSIINYELFCQKVHDFSPNRELDNDSFQWIEKEVVIFGYISKFRHTIEIFQLKQSIVTKLFMISTSLKDENSLINSFCMTEQYIYVVLEKKGEIQIYSLFDQQLIYIITSQDVQPYELKPKFVRIDKKQNLIIIANQESLIAGFLYDRFNMVTYLYFPECRQIEVSLASYSFFVALHFGHQQELREYSMRRRSVSFLKKIPLFHYILQTPLQMMSSLEQIIVRAYTPVLQQTVLLVYQPDANLRESLLTHIPLGWYLKDSLRLGITKVYYYGLLIHASSKFGIKNLLIYKNFQAVISSQWNDEYIHKKEILIHYDSIDSPEQIEFRQNVTFLNLMTNIAALVSNESLLVTQAAMKISNGWFKGQIIKYQAECQQCQDQIMLTQKIDLIQSLEYFSALLDQCQLDDDYFVFLTANQLIFLDSMHYVKHPTFYFSLDNQYTINKIWCKNDTILITGQTNTYAGFVQMIKYQDKQYQLIGEPFQIKLSYQLLQLELLDDGNFLILDGYQIIGGYMYYTSRICAYHYEYTPPKSVSYTYTPCVDSRKHSEFYASSFITYKINNKYRVFLSDLSQGLFIQDFHYIDSSIKCISADDTLYRVSLRLPIEQMMGLNIDDEVRYLKVIRNGNPQNNFQIFKMILLTNSIAHLSLVLYFEDNIYQKLYIDEMIQRYSDFDVYYEASLEKDYLALAYQTNYYTICIYKLGQKEQPTLMMAGVDIAKSYPNQFFSLHSDENGQTLLQLNKDNKKLNLYVVDEFATLSFLGNATEQPITLTALNQLTQASIILNIHMSAIVPTNLYWILLTILFCVLFLLALLALIVYQKNKRSRNKLQSQTKRNKGDAYCLYNQQ